MGSFAEDLETIEVKYPGPPCGISVVLEHMDNEDRDALNLVLFEKPRRYSNRNLQKFLISKHYDVSFSSVALHRRKECRCFTGKASRVSVKSDV